MMAKHPALPRFGTLTRHRAPAHMESPARTSAHSPPRTERRHARTLSRSVASRSPLPELNADVLCHMLQLLDEDRLADDAAVRGGLRVPPTAHGREQSHTLLLPSAALSAVCRGWRDAARGFRSTTLRVPSFWFTRHSSLLAIPRCINASAGRLSGLRVLLFSSFDNLDDGSNTLFLNLKHCCPQLVALALPRLAYPQRSFHELSRHFGTRLEALSATSTDYALPIFRGQFAFPALRSLCLGQMCNLHAALRRPAPAASRRRPLRLRADCVSLVKRFPKLERLVIEEWEMIAVGTRRAQPSTNALDLDAIRAALGANPMLIAHLMWDERDPRQMSEDMAALGQLASTLPCLAFPGAHRRVPPSEWLAGVRQSAGDEIE